MSYKGRLQNPTAGWPAVPSGSGRLSLFRTIETGQNRTEPPVDRRLGFEAVPKWCFQLDYDICRSPFSKSQIIQFLPAPKNFYVLKLFSILFDFNFRQASQISPMT